MYNPIDYHCSELKNKLKDHKDLFINDVLFPF